MITAPAVSIDPVASPSREIVSCAPLLINGASAHLRQQMRRGVSDPWLRELLARRPYKVAMVAFAAKTARIIWAMLAKGELTATAQARRLLPD